MLDFALDGHNPVLLGAGVRRRNEDRGLKS